MGANAQTTVPTFTAGQVLTADQQNQSARTGVPVFSSTGNRDAAFGGTGEKTLAEGQLAYVEGTGLQSYNGTSWITWGAAPSSGLELISSTTIGSAVSSVTVSGAFSASYDNYCVVVNGGTASTALNLLLQLGATTTGYYRATIGRTYGNADNSGATANGSNWFFMGAEADGFFGSADIYTPFLTARTGFHCANPLAATNGSLYVSGGYQNSATSFTAFTLTTSTGTITGGTIKVYGYKN